jgi:hypothetical protein
MRDTDPYTIKIKQISLSQGVPLNNDQALEVLLRLTELIEVVYERKNAR